MQKIIFLDIDGPIINLGCYGIDNGCSHKRSVMNQSAIGFVNLLCHKTGAKVVTNSSHNPHSVDKFKLDPVSFEKVRCGATDLREDLIRHGLKAENFHKEWRTGYPLKMSGVNSHRLDAIDLWQVENGEVNWIAFDDCIFTQDPRLIVVDFNNGITHNLYIRALKLFKVDENTLLY
jgi:hypothetical protein